MAALKDTNGFIIEIIPFCHLTSYIGRRGITLIHSPWGKTVFNGYWMDWPERHWNISEFDYFQLSPETRASLECREQVHRKGPESLLTSFFWNRVCRLN